MPRFIDTQNNFEFNGEFDCENHGPDAGENILIIPAGATLPAITFNDGEMYFVIPSGILGVTVGGAWRTIVGS